MPKLTYEIELTPENASKIDAVNKILLGDAYVEEAPVKKPVKESTSTNVSKETKPQKSEGLSLEDLKTAAKKAKADHGEDFTMQVLKDAGVAVAVTLGRSMSAVDEDLYAEVIAAWEAGPTEQAKDEPEDDDLGDDDGLDDEEDEAVVDAEAVKTALKAYSKEHGRDTAKELMTKHKVKALSGVDDLSPAALAKLMKELI